MNKAQCEASKTQCVDLAQYMGKDEMNDPISLDEVIKMIKKQRTISMWSRFGKKLVFFLEWSSTKRLVSR